MAGAILLSAMLVCGVWLYVKRRRERIRDAMIAEAEAEETAMTQDGNGNDNYKNDQSDSLYNKHNSDIHDDIEKQPHYNKKNGHK